MLKILVFISKIYLKMSNIWGYCNCYYKKDGKCVGFTKSIGGNLWCDNCPFNSKKEDKK